MDKPGFKIYRCYNYQTIAALLLSTISTISFARIHLDGIVKEVLGQPILHSQVLEKQGQPNLVPVKNSGDAYTQALADLTHLIYVKEHMKFADIETSEDKVDAHIERIITTQKISKERLAALLKQEGKSMEDYRRLVKDQITVANFEGMVLMPLVRITETDIKEAYLKKANIENVTKFHLRQINITPPIGKNAALKEDLIQSIHKLLSNKLVSFSQAEKLYSELETSKDLKALKNKITNIKKPLPSPEKKVNSQDLWVVDTPSIIPELRAAISKLKVKSFTKVLKLKSGYFIFYLEDKTKKPRIDSFGKDYEQQKLAIENSLRRERVSGQWEIWLNEAKQLKTPRIQEKK